MPRRRHLETLMTTLLVVLGLAACSDAPTDPTTMLIAVETEAALDLGIELPTLDRLIEDLTDRQRSALDSADQRQLEEALALWQEAEALGSSSGSHETDTLHTTAYTLAAPVLASVLDAKVLESELGRMVRWDREAQYALRSLRRSAPRNVDPLRRRLGQARSQIERVEDALDENDRVTAIEAVLEAADRLAQTTPGAVAHRLVAHAEHTIGALRANDDHRRTLRVRRAERLIRGARESLDNADFARAIRRAYYASQLLEP